MLYDFFAKQITHLNIDFVNNTPHDYWITRSYIFTSILFLCKRLINLNFCQFSNENLTISMFGVESERFMSSTLTNLKINVNFIDDCLWLLDGRLTCLSTLIISITEISNTKYNTDNTASAILINHILGKNTCIYKRGDHQNWKLMELV
jgi:hypothetical protein